MKVLCVMRSQEKQTEVFKRRTLVFAAMETPRLRTYSGVYS
jgi:hypothetical protein